MVSFAKSPKPKYSKILSISSDPDIFTILIFSSFLSFSLLFSPLLYFSLLDWFQINLNYIINLSTVISRQLNLCRHTRISWMNFLSVSGLIFVGKQVDRACLYFLFMDLSLWAHEEIIIAFLFCLWINISSVTLLSDCFLLAHMTDVSALLQLFGWDDQSRYFFIPVSHWCTVSTRSGRWCSLFIA